MGKNTKKSCGPPQLALAGGAVGVGQQPLLGLELLNALVRRPEGGRRLTGIPAGVGVSGN